MATLFELCEYGISPNTVKDLINKNATYYDIIFYGSDFLKGIKGYNNTKMYKIIEYVKKISKEESIYELCLYDKSVELIKYFSEMGCELDDLRKYNNIQLTTILNIELNNINRRRIDRLKNALKILDENKSQSVYLHNKHYEDVLERYIKAKFSYNENSLAQIKNYLIYETNYPIVFFDNDISILKKANKLTYTTVGIKLNKKEIKIPRLEELVNSINNQITKQIILLILDGKTLSDVGKEYGLTRESVRQKKAKIFSKYFNEVVYEDCYKEVFEEYYFDKEIFCNFYNVEGKVYEYLNYKYKKGTKELLDMLNDRIVTIDQKKLIYEKFNLIEIFDTIIKCDKIEIIKVLLKEFAAQKVKISDFMYIYNQIINENKRLSKLTITSERNLEGTLSRIDNCLFGFSKMIKYYNLDLIDKEIMDKLKELINLPKGYYSALVIYTNNSSLMKNLNINDEYELHNLLKLLFKHDDFIRFSKMPTFYTYKASKEKFIEKIIDEFAPINLDELLIKIEDEYGHKKLTMASYICTAFPRYIQGNMVIGNLYQISDVNHKILKEKLVEDVYEIKEIEYIIKKYTDEKNENVINNNVLHQLGYKIMSNYIIKNTINNIEEYLNNKILEKDFYNISDIKNIQTFKHAISKMQEQLDIIMFSDAKYITITKLNKVGISKSDLQDFRNEILSKYKCGDFFTINSVEADYFENNKLEKFGFEDVFYESIITSDQSIKVLRIENNKIMYVGDRLISKFEFVQRIVNKFRSLTIYEMANYLKAKYGILVQECKIREIVKKSEVFYNSILDEAFVDKNEYLEEVFKNV
ncbi:MAG: hypothetical protein RR623_03490 [Bacilli bacterium]